jgi:hypothetical protein
MKEKLIYNVYIGSGLLVSGIGYEKEECIVGILTLP